MATHSSGYKSFDQGHEFESCDAEPLIDKARLEQNGDLTILTTNTIEPARGGIERNIVVIYLKAW